METYQLIVVKEIDNIDEAIKQAKKAEIIDSVYSHTKDVKVFLGNSIIYENGNYSFDFFRNTMYNWIFKCNVKAYIKGYENSVATAFSDDKIEFYTRDEDKEFFGGKVVKKGQVVFEVTRKSIIEDGNKEGEFDIRGEDYRDFTLWIEEDIFNVINGTERERKRIQIKSLESSDS